MNRYRRGLTLIELLVTISVAVILLAVAVPSFSRMTANTRVTTASNLLSTHLKYARSEALKRSLPVTICASTDGAVCSGVNQWETGWVVFTDEGTKSAPDGSDLILQIEGAHPAGISIAADAAAIRFLSDASVEF